MARRAWLVGLVFLLPEAALAGVVWRGDFETADRSQWSSTQMVNADRLAVVTSPTRQGQYALKTTVRQGDDPIGSSGNRNELVRKTNETEGDEYYYRWSSMFAADFPSVDTWQLFTQWHHSGSNGSPPVEFFVRGESIRLSVRKEGGSGVTIWSTPLHRGVWNDFVFHVKWSSNPQVGFVELYLNGELVLPRKYTGTLFAGMTNYLKMGLYRNAIVTGEGVVFHDGMIQATTLADVMPTQPLPPVPPVPPVPPTPTPDAGEVDAGGPPPVVAEPTEEPTEEPTDAGDWAGGRPDFGDDGLSAQGPSSPTAQEPSSATPSDDAPAGSPEQTPDNPDWVPFGCSGVGGDLASGALSLAVIGLLGLRKRRGNRR